MQMHQVPLWTDEIVFLKGAIHQQIKRHEEMLSGFTAGSPAAIELGKMYDNANGALKRALETLETVLPESRKTVQPSAAVDSTL